MHETLLIAGIRCQHLGTFLQELIRRPLLPTTTRRSKRTGDSGGLSLRPTHHRSWQCHVICRRKFWRLSSRAFSRVPLQMSVVSCKMLAPRSR